MSLKADPVSQALLAYMAERAPGEDDFLAELRAAAVEEGIPAISIGAPQGAAMQVLLRIAKAREVVEVGTLAGYSAIWMARGLPAGGRVRTIEVSPKHAEFAQAWADRSDAAGKVEVHQGPGVEVLPGFAAESADAMFIDADKANYQNYLEHAARILRPGGLLMVDNAFAFGHLLNEEEQGDSVRAIRAFNDHMPTVSGFTAVMMAVGDGMWVGVKAG